MFKAIIYAFFILAIWTLIMHYRADTYFEAGVEAGKAIAWEEMERNVSDHWVKWILKGEK